MYSIPENLEGTQFSGWINEDLLMKDGRRSATSRKRNYELVNVDIEEQCDDQRRRVLRPRHNVELPSTPDASRTRPIKSNRIRGRQFFPLNSNDINGTSTNNGLLEQPQVSTLLTDPIIPSSSNNLPLFQVLESHSWPQNNFLAHSESSNIPRIQQPMYSPFNNLHQIPPFDPWVLHNYLLASSNYSTTANGPLPQESDQEDHIRNIAQLRYPSMVSENILNRNFIWQYPFMLNSTFNHLQGQVPLVPESQLNPNVAQSVESNSDMSYFMRPTNSALRDNSSNSNETFARTERVQTGMYTNERPITHYNNHSLPNPFSYGSLCPYHNTNHIIHHSPSSSHPLSNLSESVIQQHSFESFPQTSELNFGHYWHQVSPSLRSVNYPINSTNIDTLLHLAAHFEQRKRGITREELDKLPTHRFKARSERVKREKMCSEKSKGCATDDLHKCLVCLDDFESKQSIRTLCCQHEFHAKCIDKWLKINRTCPLCRADAFDGTAQKDGA